MSSVSLFLNFSCSLSDGGYPVTSYTVEWDTEARIPEVRQIMSSLDLNARDVQTITSTTIDVNKIQFVSALATSRGVVQTITVSPPFGKVTVNSS